MARRFLPLIILLVGVAVGGVSPRVITSNAIAGAVPTPGPAATPTPVATPTPSLPSPAQLLGFANGATASKGSVNERGMLRSSDHVILPGYVFTAAMSWRTHIFRDQHIFPDPVFMKAAGGYVTSVRRIDTAKSLDQKLDQRWRCSLSNSDPRLWQPPAFTFAAPRLEGTAVIRGRPAWKVGGQWTHHTDGLTMRLNVETFIDKSRDVYLASSVSGTVTNRSGAQSHVTGSVVYGSYSGSIEAVQPQACLHAKRNQRPS